MVGLFQQRDSHSQALFFLFKFLLPRKIDPLSAFGRRAIPETSQHAVHVAPEFLWIAEGVNPDRSEEMTDATGGRRGIGETWPEGGTAKDRAQDIDHDRQSVALVPAQVLAQASQKASGSKQSSVLSTGDRGKQADDVPFLNLGG